MNQKKIYFPTFGSGIGHANRNLLIAKSLNNNYKYFFSSFSDGYEFLTANGMQCRKIPKIDVSWNKDGTVSTIKTVISLPKLISIFLYHLGYEFNLISKQKPDLIFSDSRLSPILCSKRLDVPSIVILNQIKLLVRLQNKRRKKLEQINAELLGRLWNYANEILIPDLPPPNTICIENIEGVKSIKNNIEYIGFISREIDYKKTERIKKELKLVENKPTIYIQISGPEQSRPNIYNNIIKQMKSVQNKYNIIISKGNPNGNTEPKKINEIIVFEWCPFKEMFQLSDCMITRGGHSTIGNSITCGKPSIIIPIKNQTEQIQNAVKMEKLGLGINLEEKNIHNSLLNSINKIFNENKFISNVEKFQNLTREYNGIETCKKKITKYVN